MADALPRWCAFPCDRSRPIHFRQKAGRGRGMRATEQMNGEDGGKGLKGRASGQMDASLQPSRTENESAEWGEGWVVSEGRREGGFVLPWK